MIDLYLVSILVFIAVLVVIVYKDRKKFTREFILLLRKTQTGKGFLIRIGTRFPRFWKSLGMVGVIVGFVISAWIFYTFIILTADNMMRGGGAGLSFVLPTVSAEPAVGPGYLAIPFWYWVIVIGCLALVHEGLHGIMAASQKVRIKSLGWGLLLVIPLAFVEPDEKQLERMGSWVQLRVFAAGSFANFMLAGLSFLLLSWLAFSLYMPAGVAFQGYPGMEIAPTDILSVNGFNVSSVEGLKTYLQGLDNSTPLQVRTENETYYSLAGPLLKGLEGKRVAVFGDWGAVKANLTGTIIQIGGNSVSDMDDLREALEKIGPEKKIGVITRDEKGENKTFELTTKGEPPSTYSPDTHSLVVIWFDQYIPGTIDSLNAASAWWGSVWGAKAEESWRTKGADIAFWTYAKEHFPIIAERAEQRITVLKAEQAQYTQAGFLGIARVFTFYDLREGFGGQKPLIEFLNGLLFWMFLINFGVGAFNLLPIRILDGGRMWEIVLKRLTKRYREVMRSVSMLTIFLLLLNFALIAGIAF